MAGNSSSGRRRKPTHLKLIEGRHYRLNRNEPVPVGDLSEPPAVLDAAQRAAWIYAIQHAPKGLLKQLDAGVLQCWVVAKCLHDEAVTALQSSPRIIKSPNGMPTQSPWIQILNKQAVLMVKFGGELGFSPASRARVSVDTGDEEDDLATRFFGPVCHTN